MGLYIVCSLYSRLNVYAVCAPEAGKLYSKTIFLKCFVLFTMRCLLFIAAILRKYKDRSCSPK